MTLLLLYLALALGVSFLCSLLEATLLSVPASHLVSLAKRGRRSAQRLQAMKAEIDRPLAAILALNTIAHTVGAAGVGAQSAVVFGSAWVGAASAVLTLLILVASEIVPKTLGAVHARSLVGFTATTIRWMIVLCYPLVVVCEWVSGLFGGGSATHAPSRDEVHAVAEMGRDHGVLSHEESRVIRNLLRLRDVRVRAIMTPRRVLHALHRDTTVGDVTTPNTPPPFARIPIYDRDLDDLVGLVHRYAIVEADSRGRDSLPLSELASPIHAVPETVSVAQVLATFLDRREQLFQVVDEFGGTAGVVTLEDAFESLLGVEIVDETDIADDMREWARRRRDRDMRLRSPDTPGER